MRVPGTSAVKVRIPLPPLAEIQFYIPFADGALQYDCPSCTALCCRGQGFDGSLRREMTELLSIYPSLAASVVARRGSVLSFQTTPGGCSFLSADNRCEIEQKHGFRLKPGVCGLFPFNRFSRLAPNIVVIGPHFLCPLQVVTPPRPGEVLGTHALMKAAALESGLLDSVLFSANSPPLLPAGAAAADVLAREEAFRDICGAAAGYLRFRNVLAARSLEHVALDHWLRRAAALFALTVPDASSAGELPDRMDAILCILAPVWRVAMAAGSVERNLRILALAEVLLRRALDAATATPQQVHRYFERVLPAATMLAEGAESEAPLLPSASKRRPPNFGDPAMVFAADRALQAATEVGMLAALERHLPPLLSEANRFALLFELAAAIPG